MIGLGASLAVLRVVQQVPRWQSPRWSNAALFCLVASLIGARLFYVFFQWPFYRLHILESVALWKGGLSWAGAIPGAYFGCWFLAKRWKTGFLKIADALSPMIPPLVIFIWLGCWLGGYAYGWAAPQGAFWGVPARDEAGVLLERFPLQLTAAVSMLAFAFWLETRKSPFQKAGQKVAVMQLGLAVNLLIFIPMQADPAPVLFDIRLDVWAALAFFLFSVAIFYRLFSRSELSRT